MDVIDKKNAVNLQILLKKMLLIFTDLRKLYYLELNIFIGSVLIHERKFPIKFVSYLFNEMKYENFVGYRKERVNLTLKMI